MKRALHHESAPPPLFFHNLPREVAMLIFKLLDQMSDLHSLFMALTGFSQIPAATAAIPRQPLLDTMSLYLEQQQHWPDLWNRLRRRRLDPVMNDLLGGGSRKKKWHETLAFVESFIMAPYAELFTFLRIDCASYTYKEWFDYFGLDYYIATLKYE